MGLAVCTKQFRVDWLECKRCVGSVKSGSKSHTKFILAFVPLRLVCLPLRGTLMTTRQGLASGLTPDRPLILDML